MRPIRATIVCNQIIPYRTPVFNALAQVEGIDLEVVYLSRREKNRKWAIDEQLGHNFRTLPSWSTYLPARDWPIHVHRGLKTALDMHAPEVVVTMGYDSPGFWQAAWWARQNGAGRVLYMGSTALSSRTRGGPIGYARRRFVSSADAFLAYGSWARDYLVSLGARWEDIFLGMNTVDVHGVAAGVAHAQPMPRRAAHEVLYIGQLIERKGVRVLLEGLAKLPEADWRLHLVGSGPQEEELKDTAARLGLAGRTVFHGYKQKRDLYPLMAGADILVMPSQLEVWGLVVNEGLAAGLFVVAGQTAGAVPDLIRPGINGLTVDATSAAHVAEVMGKAFALPKDRAAIRMSVEDFTPERTAKALAQAVGRAWEKKWGRGGVGTQMSQRTKEALNQ